MSKKKSPNRTEGRERRERKALEKAIAYFPTLKDMGQHLGVDYQLIQGWRDNGTPFERCAAVETATRGRVKCEQLNERWTPVTTRPFQFIEG